MKTGNKFIVVLTNPYFKLTRAIPTKKTTVTDVARTFVEDIEMTYGILERSLTDNSPQIIGTFFNSVCGAFGTRLMSTTVYRPQPNEQTEQIKKTIISRLRPYISEQQNSWSTFVMPLIYAYKVQPYATTKTTSFSLVLTRELPESSALNTHRISRHS